MSKPIIAVDFDDVLCPTSRLTIDFYNRTYGTKLTMQDAYTYNNSELWLADHATVLRRVNEFISTPEILRTPPIKGAVAAIKALSSDYSFVIITGRAVSVRGFTVQWLHKYFGNIFDEHVFIEELRQEESDVSKLDVCKRLGVEALIDDTPLHLQGFGNDTISGILFGGYPWSQANELNVEVVKCKNWAAVLEYFDGR